MICETLCGLESGSMGVEVWVTLMLANMEFLSDCMTKHFYSAAALWYNTIMFGCKLSEIMLLTEKGDPGFFWYDLSWTHCLDIKQWQILPFYLKMRGKLINKLILCLLFIDLAWLLLHVSALWCFLINCYINYIHTHEHTHT